MSQTVNDLLIAGIEQLKNARIDDAEISARLILGNILGKTPSELQVLSNESMTAINIENFYEDVKKRCTHYPLQYIIGEVEFYNVKLKVNRNVLIPRPETEVLIENLIKLLKPGHSIRVLEIGTGSGNIAITIASNIDNVTVTAVDISDEVLKVARNNAGLNRVADKIDFRIGDCLTERFWDSAEKYDVIVSNPPYVADSEWSSLQPEVKNYEPQIALLSGTDPLIFFRTIIGHSKSILLPGGIICFETGIKQAGDVVDIIKANFKGIDIEVIRDLSGIDRVVIGKLIE